MQFPQVLTCLILWDTFQCSFPWECTLHLERARRWEPPLSTVSLSEESQAFDQASDTIWGSITRVVVTAGAVRGEGLRNWGEARPVPGPPCSAVETEQVSGGRDMSFSNGIRWAQKGGLVSFCGFARKRRFWMAFWSAVPISTVTK